MVPGTFSHPFVAGDVVRFRDRWYADQHPEAHVFRVTEIVNDDRDCVLEPVDPTATVVRTRLPGSWAWRLLEVIL